MKIAFLSYNRDPSIPEIDNDGCPVTVRNYALELSKSGHKIDIFANKIIPEQSDNDYIKSKFRLQDKNEVSVNKKVRVFRVPVMRVKNRKLFNSDELLDFPDIIDSFLSAEFFLDGKLETYDLACFFHPIAALGTILRSTCSKIKTILFPMSLSDEYKKHETVTKLYIDLEQLILSSVSFICSSSDYEERVLLKRGIETSKITVIHRGYDRAVFCGKPRERPNFGKKINFVCTSAIRPLKKQDLLVGIASLLIQEGYMPHFTIIGDNLRFPNPNNERYYKEILDLIKENNFSEYFSFVGLLKPEKVAEALKSADIAILPSIAESFGKAALESLCMGVPTIVCRDVEAYSTFIEPEKNAITVENNCEDYAKAIIRLINDTDLYKTLSLNGYKTGSNFGWDKVSKDLEHFLISCRDN